MCNVFNVSGEFSELGKSSEWCRCFVEECERVVLLCGGM